MSSQWSRINAHDRRSAPTFGGVYALIAGGRVHYVGMSTCIRNRLAAHNQLPLLWRAFGNDGVIVAYSSSRSVHADKRREDRLIAFLQPPLNHDRPLVWPRPRPKSPRAPASAYLALNTLR